MTSSMEVYSWGKNNICRTLENGYPKDSSWDFNGFYWIFTLYHLIIYNKCRVFSRQPWGHCRGYMDVTGCGSKAVSC
jgi:hypothetical protein